MQTVLVGPIDNVIMQTAKRAQQAYGTKVRELGHGHQLGPPSVHVWLRVWEALHQAGIGVSIENSEEVSTYWQQLQATSQEDMYQHVDMARVTRLCNQEQAKFVVMVDGSGRTKLFANCCEQLGLTSKVGRAPKGSLERQMEEWLDWVVEED